MTRPWTCELEHFGTALTNNAGSYPSDVAATVTPGYLAVGLRAWKQTAAGRTYFLYDGDTLLAELDAAGNVTATVTTGPNGLLSRRTGGSTVPYTYDPHAHTGVRMDGSVAQRLDATGTVLSSHLWDAYGSGAASGAWSDPAGYGAQWGYYRDGETGLYLLTHRYYDPGTGRFLTRDPFSYAGGINLYGYCGNRPTVLTDPRGLSALALPILLIPGAGPVLIGAGVIIGIGGSAVILTEWIESHPWGRPGICFSKESKKSDREKATDIPSWLKGGKPNPGESVDDFLKRAFDEKYGKMKWETPRSDPEYKKGKKGLHRG